MNITFDTDCLIELDANSITATDLCKLVEAHDTGQLTISVPAIIPAIRKSPDRWINWSMDDNFSTFQQRLCKLAKREFRILKPPFSLAIAYVEWCIQVEDSHKLEHQIKRILFPEMESSWDDHAKALGLVQNLWEPPDTKAIEEWFKWFNHFVDILNLWCHIYYGNDVFVTRNAIFHEASKKEVLEKLGAKQILFPHEVHF